MLFSYPVLGRVYFEMCIDLNNDGIYQYRQRWDVYSEPVKPLTARYSDSDYHNHLINRRSSDIHGAALGKCLQAWT